MVLRMMSLLFLFASALPLLSWMLEGMSDADLWDLDYYLGRITISVAALAIAAVCRFFDRPLSRWIVPIPSPECPSCGYSLEHLRHPRCPECGISLPGALTDTEVPPDEPPPPR